MECKFTKDESKLFGKYNELVFLLIGFILTTILGGILTYLFQQNSWKHTSEFEQLKTERETATKTFDEVSRLMDQRHFRLKNVVHIIETNSNTSELSKALSEYKKIVTEWNDSQSRNSALIKRYFGEGLREFFEINISGSFRLLDQKTDEALTMRAFLTRSELLDEILQVSDQLEYKAYRFNIVMIELIQRGNVGVFFNQREEEKWLEPLLNQ